MARWDPAAWSSCGDDGRVSSATTAILLDSADHGPRERVEAARSLVDDLWASDISFDRPASELEFRMRLDTFGPIIVSHSQWNSVRIQMNSSADVPDEVPRLSCVLHRGADGRFEQGRRQRRLRRSGPVLIDLTQPYLMEWSGDATSTGLLLDLRYLGLEIADVRRAIETPMLDSPMGQMTLNHIRYVVDNIAELSTNPVARDVTARTTSDLFRALIAQALNQGDLVGDARAETELSRVLAYARLRIRRVDLTPRTIAAAHFVSERHLYRLCERDGLSLADWILTERLLGARRDLSDSTHAGRTVEAIAFSWGFRSAAHFSRRFKGKFGASPNEWRRLHAT